MRQLPIVDRCFFVSRRAPRPSAASRDDLVVQVLRVLRLREEEPAIGDQARRLHGSASAARATARAATATTTSDAGSAKPNSTKHQLDRCAAPAPRRVEELARVERAGRHAHRASAPAGSRDAGRGLQRRLGPEPRVAAPAPARARRRRRRRRRASGHRASAERAPFAGQRRRARARRTATARGQADQDVVDERQRLAHSWMNRRQA